MFSNLGNSKAGVIEAIRAAERIHWFLGLKQAENTIFSQKSILRSNYWSNRKNEREIELKQEKIKFLKIVFVFCRLVPIVQTMVRNKIETLSDEINAWKESALEREALARDCAYELAVAEEELSRILDQHPEIKNLAYEELQNNSLIALSEKKSNYLISRYWAAKNNLPETVGVTLFEASDEERDHLITRIAQKLYGIPATEETIRVAGIIAQLPLHEQQSLLQNQIS